MNHLRKRCRDFQDFCSRNSGIIEKTSVLLLCIGLCLFHYKVREYRADTLFFQKALKQYSLFGFLKWRSDMWTGRLILEGLLYIILKFPYLVFAVLDSAIILGAVYVLRSLLGWKRLESTVFMLLLLIFPMDGLIIVGIQPGAINYIWSLAASVIALLPLGMIYRSKKIQWYHYITFGAAALVGSNMEQTAAIVFCFYFLAAVYFFLHKKLKPIMFSQMLLSLLSLIYLLTCKGNVARLSQETAHFWPGFDKLPITEKFWNGWYTTVNYFYTTKEVPFFIFLVILFVWLWMKYRKVNVFTVCVTIPLLFLIGIWASGFLHFPSGAGIQTWAAGVRYIGPAITPQPMPIYPQVILYTILFLMVFAAVCGCSRSIEETVLIVLILCAGFATRLLMGFSPTLLASGDRTYFFMDAALCITSTMLVRKIWDGLRSKLRGLYQ